MGSNKLELWYCNGGREGKKLLHSQFELTYELKESSQVTFGTVQTQINQRVIMGSLNNLGLTQGHLYKNLLNLKLELTQRSRPKKQFNRIIKNKIKKIGDQNKQLLRAHWFAHRIIRTFESSFWTFKGSSFFWHSWVSDCINSYNLLVQGT